MNSRGSVRVPKILLENLQHEVERLRGQLLDSKAEMVNRERLRDRFVEASAPLWKLVQHVRGKDHLSTRFLDASSPLWTLVQDQADEIDHARQHAARSTASEELGRADHWLDELYGHLNHEDDTSLNQNRDDGDEPSGSMPRVRADDSELQLGVPPAPPQGLGASPGRSVTHLPVPEAVGVLFVSWCNENSLLVSRAHLFEAKLRAAMSAEVHLEPIYRLRDEPSPVFSRVASAGPDYWLFQAGEVLLILPHPVRPDQFRELAPVYSGQAEPRTVGGLVPAAAGVQQNMIRLVSPGNIMAG